MRHHPLGIFLLIFWAHFATCDVALGRTVPSSGVSEEKITAVAKREAAESIARFKDTYEKQLLQIAEEKLKLSHALLSSIAWIGGIATAILAFLTFFGIKISGRWLKDTLKEGIAAQLLTFREEASKKLEAVREAIEREIQRACQDTLARADTEIKQLSESMKQAEENIMTAQARLFMRIGLQQWQLSRSVSEPEKRRLLGHAINDTEKALDLVPSNEGLRTQIKSNLSYFYAELELKDKRGIALTYAEEARELAGKYGERATNWLVNHSFVKMKYANTREELQEAITLLDTVEKEFPTFSDEVRTYREEALRRRDLLEGVYTNSFSSGSREGSKAKPIAS